MQKREDPRIQRGRRTASPFGSETELDTHDHAASTEANKKSLDNNNDFIKWIRETCNIDGYVAKKKIAGLEDVRARYYQYLRVKELLYGFSAGRKGGYAITARMTGTILTFL